MDRYVSPKKFIQYQLWQDCNNDCAFCFERKAKPVDREWAINFILDKLDDPEVLEFEEVGIIGGEIFDNQLKDPKVEELFYKLLTKICSMHFEKIYIATSLLYNMEKYLIPCLNFLRKCNVQHKVLICTSYDTKWRFKTQAQEDFWSENLLRLKREFPDFNTHIEMILTGDFIDRVLEGTFDIAAFSKKYDSRIDYNEPVSGMYYADKAECQKECPNFFPTKAKFMQFLKQECLQKKSVDINCLASYQLRASRVYCQNLGQYVRYEDRRKPGFRMKCLDTTKKYEVGMIDSDKTMEEICVELCSMLYEE